MKIKMIMLMIGLLMFGLVPTVSATVFFESRVTYLVGDQPGDVITYDLDGDTNLDLIVSNEYSHNISVLLGNGDGTFNGRLNYALTSGHNPNTMQVADIDGDGVLDIISGEINGIDILFGEGNGTFHSVFFVDVARVNRLVVDDFNGDLKPDIATTDILSDSVGIHLNNGDSTFTSSYVQVAYASQNIISGKFDVDSYPDIVLGCNNGSIWNLKNDGAGGFTAVNVHTDTCSAELNFETADFNGNTVQDLLVANRVTDSITVFLNNGDGTYVVSHNFYPEGEQPIAMDLADVNADSVDDLIVSVWWEGNMRVHLGTGNGFFTYDPWSYTGGNSSDGLTTGDFDKDGYVDLAAVVAMNDSVAVFINRMSLILSVDDITPEGLLPTQFSLEQNYPNPFNPETVIRFSIPSATHVKLELFNLLGQSVNVLVDEELSAGFKEVRWNGRDDNNVHTASGIYFYRITTEDFIETKKMLLLK